MDKKIEKIVNDLYMIDGSLKKHEKEIVYIVEELLRSKPDVEVNEEFIEKLHLALVSRMEHLKEGKKIYAGSSGSNSFFSRLAYSFAGAMAMLLVTVVGVSYYLNQTKTPGDIIAVNSIPGIEKLKDGAFGSLAFDSSKTAFGLGGAASGVGGGGSPAIGDQKTGAGMPGPDIANYRFVYKGGDIPLQDKATVYKRVKNLPAGDKIIRTLASLNLGLIDINKFTNTRMSGLSFSEDRSFGYDVNIDFREGVASIWAGTGWPDPNAACRDQACYEKNQLKASDMPKDEEVIAIANKFLNDYRIDKSAYTEPAIVKDNNVYYKNPAAQDSILYIPETVSIVYPIKIDNKIVYDDIASPTGMMVDVSIRQKKVFGVRNIYGQKYESSDYEAEQDKNKIISVAENGGTFGNYRSPEAAQTIDIELGTPEIKLIASWNYDAEKRITESLFIPSYVFPVTKVQDGKYYYRKNLVVPMPKEMIDKLLQSPQPMPGLLGGVK